MFYFISMVRQYETANLCNEITSLRTVACLQSSEKDLFGGVLFPQGDKVLANNVQDIISCKIIA